MFRWSKRMSRTRAFGLRSAGTDRRTMRSAITVAMPTEVVMTTTSSPASDFTVRTKWGTKRRKWRRRICWEKISALSWTDSIVRGFQHYQHCTRMYVCVSVCALWRRGSDFVAISIWFVGSLAFFPFAGWVATHNSSSAWGEEGGGGGKWHGKIVENERVLYWQRCGSTALSLKRLQRFWTSANGRSGKIVLHRS